MKVRRLKVQNFRGIKSATPLLPNHAVLIGDNNTGKTTLLEALDLVLGPDRLNRSPPIDEHDFFQGKYIAAIEAVEPGVTPNEAGAGAPRIEIEATVIDLSLEQKAKFHDYIEFWDAATDEFYDEADPEGVDGKSISEALRVTFIGSYNTEEDDFEGKTYFTRSLSEGDTPEQFFKRHKQACGFLYLRSLRTGSRALSLERGSLLDVILRLKELRPRMWEDTITKLAQYSVASDRNLEFPVS